MTRFPKIESLRGELKRSEVRSGIRYQLTTREFILQRDRRTYRIALQDILGLIECTDSELAGQMHLAVGAHAAGKPYKIVTSLLYQISPSGVREQTFVSFYTRLSPAFASQMAGLLASS
ncbi:MAG: hypothetical protein IRZ33_08175 [Alicyclobacillaceae bacterium]|nr:hypothetical protein [Alicyclobacillaceae bacterium]